MSDPATPDAPDAALPPSLRLLKWLVILLTLTMIGGVITVVGLLVTRMPQAFSATAPNLPEGLRLPEGTQPAAITFGAGWIAVVTTDDRILIYGRNGTLRQDLRISPVPGP
jgi:Flp pilus assembly protein protease CpaA